MSTRSIWQRLFSREIKPEKLVEDLKRQERESDTELRKLDYDSRKFRRDMEGIVARGVRAVDQGDPVGKSEAAMELKACKAEVQQLQSHRLNLIKGRMLARTSIRKLERFGSTQAQEVFSAIIKVMNDPRVGDMLANAEIRAEEFEEKLTRLVDLELSHLDDKATASRHEHLTEERLFEQLAEATKAGNAEKAAEIQNNLMGTKTSATKEVELAV